MRTRTIAASLAIILALFHITVPALADSSLEQYTPKGLTASLLPVDGLHPYGSAELRFSIDSLPVGDAAAPWAVSIEKKIGAGPWIEVSFDDTRLYRDSRSLGGSHYHFEQLWNEDTAYTTDLTVSYRVRVAQCDSTFSAVSFSGWSNIAAIGIKSSAWASADIAKADGYGLVPASIKDDYTRPITRQEFAELVVRLYEAKMKAPAEPVAENPFTDCNNPEVLKAYNLKIINGVSATTFKPADLTNREQIAAMLYRAVRAIAPEADMSIAGSPAFNDSKAIAPYFLEYVQFMSKHGFIKGANGNFDPKGTCTREMAVVIALRVYERYAPATE